MNRDFVKALNAKDAVAAAKCYTEDATLLPPNEAPVKGRANIQKYWEGAIAAAPLPHLSSYLLKFVLFPFS